MDERELIEQAAHGLQHLLIAFAVCSLMLGALVWFTESMKDVVPKDQIGKIREKQSAIE
jgi:hypothetical protein